MNVVLIVPTGLGAKIGGYAGDANPVAKLIGACCDNLITHPNVVNASDINEMPDNTWYVEGGMLDEFLQGNFYLKRPYRNRILLAANKPLANETVNAASAARATIGADITIVELETPLRMISIIKDGVAGGYTEGHYELVQQVKKYDWDVLAVTSPIETTKESIYDYFHIGGVNPWGGVEAILSKTLFRMLGKPAVHAPLGDLKNHCFLIDYNEVTSPRIAPEMVSITYLHSVFKGLHRAPRVSDSGLSNKDIDFLISPFGCYGPPHIACEKNNIPIIVVRENKTALDDHPRRCTYVDNYLEAAGLIMATKAGVTSGSVRRLILNTKVHKNKWLK